MKHLTLKMITEMLGQCTVQRGMARHLTVGEFC